MKIMNKILIAAAIAAVMAVSGTVLAQDSNSLDQLLNEVRQSIQNENAINAQREAEFRQARDRQRQLLRQAEAEMAAAERRSDELKAAFDSNETRLAELETVLQERMGNLGEMFGVVRQVAGDVSGQFETSLVSAEIPGRSDFVSEIAQRKALPTVRELRRLWFEMQREITEQGKVVTFNASVRNENGEVEEGRSVTRVGVFNAVSDGKFLYWETSTGGGDGMLQTLTRQPAARHLSTASDLEEASASEHTAFAVDPSRGAILRTVVLAQSWPERVVKYGGLVGWVILALGAFGLLLAVWRFLALFMTEAKMKRQLKSSEPNRNNPLGRVMSVYTDNPDADVETLELKLDEAILKETPAFDRGLMILKVCYVVAPLLGLLGTVIGMIVTFQMIQLFGTGDPKMMAGGISTALITTVLGLVVAIPLTFLHSLLAGKARRLTHILEEQSAGIIALMAERE